MTISNTRIDKIKELKSILENLDRNDPAVKTRIDQIINTDLGLAADINTHLDPPKRTRSGRTILSTETTLAHYAARENYAVILDYLNEKYKTATPPIDFEAKDGRRHTPTYYAVKKNNLEAIRSLVRVGADFTKSEIVTELKKNPDLQKFLDNCQDAQKFEDELKANPEYFRTITEADLDTFISGLNNKINAVDDKKWNVAHHIARWGNETLLMHLIENDANLMAPNDEGDTAIKLIRDPDLKARIQKAYQTHLSQKGLDGVEWDKVSLTEIKSLVDFGADVSKGPYAHQALRAGKPEIVEYLISKEINLNATDSSGKTLVELAADLGDEHILMDLVEHSFKGTPAEINWSPSGKDILAEMRSTGKIALANKIEEAKNATKDLLDLSSSTLRVTWANIQPDQIQGLLDKGARVNAQNKEGKTALYQASEADNINAAKLLLKKGADPNIADKKGKTPLMNFIEHKNQAAVEALLERGADLNIADKDGKTAAHYSAEGAIIASGSSARASLDFTLLKKLAEKGPDFNKKDSSNKTALHILFEKINNAAISDKTFLKDENNQKEIMALIGVLAEKGADFNIEGNGKKPFDYLIAPNIPGKFKKQIEEEIEKIVNGREVPETSESNEPSEKIRNVLDETEERNNGNENGGNEENEGNEDPSSQISDRDALQNIMDSIKDPDKAHPGAVKRVTDAMKAATDKWFEGITKSGMSMEDFSTAVLMCSLAFPLDALGTLIEKKYSESTDDKLDKVNRRLEALLKQMGLPNKTIGGSSGNGNNGGNSMPDSVERAANVCALFRAVSEDLKKEGEDPDALIRDFRNAMGIDPATGKMPQELDPEKAREKFQTSLDEDRFQRLKESFKRVANTEPGRETIRGAFGYDNGNKMIQGLLGRDLNEYEKGNATPRIAETIMESYQKIMDSDTDDLTKAKKRAKLATFLVEMGEKHPNEFKTLSDAFLLVQENKDLLNKLRNNRSGGPMVQRGDLFDELTDAGERKIKGKNFQEAFKGLNLTYGEEKETVNVALRLRQILNTGSEEGQAMLTAFVQSKANLAGKRNR